MINAVYSPANSAFKGMFPAEADGTNAAFLQILAADKVFFEFF